jgi:hypothetical protein
MWKGECQSFFVDLLPKSGCKDFFDNFSFLLVAGNQLQVSLDSPVFIGKYGKANGESSMEVMRVIELKKE